MTKLVQLLISGISVGCVYGLIALGFVLVYKATRTFNFAQGHLMMVGAYMIATFGTILGLDAWLAIPLALAAGVIVGVAFQSVFVRPLLGQDLLAVVMATIAAAMIIEATVQLAYGTRDRVYQTPFSQRVIDVHGVHIASFDLVTIGVSAVCLAVFALFFRLTSIGLQMRAAAESNEAAALSGISVNRVSVVAWSVGTVLAFIAGIILANSTQIVNVSLGGLGLLAFPAVVIGGLESIPGAVLGGVVVGVLQVLAGGYVSNDAQTPIVYAALLVMLLLRPYGLFGQRDIARV